MSFIGIRARAEWRRHAWELLALTLLVGIVGTVVLTAASGARRTRSSVERLDRTTSAADAFILFAGERPDAVRAVERLPEVEAAGEFSPMSLFSDRGYLPLVASVDGHYGATLMRDRIIHGRRPNPAEPSEIALAEPLARRLHLDVGGRLPLTGISARQSACVFGDGHGPGCAAIRDAFFAQPPDWSVFAGPRVTLHVVGITRGLQDVSARTNDFGMLVLNAAFYREYHDDVATQSAVAVRLRSGADPQAFENATARVVPHDAILDFTNSAAVFDGLQSTVGVLANGLLAFGAVALLAGFAAIAQMLARRAAAGAPDRTVLRSFGASRRLLIADTVAPVVPVAVAGAGLAVVGSWLASSLMPVGSARRIEPSPGLHFDSVVLLGGGLVVAAAVLAAAGISAWWVARHAPAPRAGTGAARTRWIGSVPAVIGRRLAFDRHGRVPVRSALSGVALGTAGVVAVATFGAGLARLGREPARYGWGWDFTVNGQRASDQDAAQPSRAASAAWDRAAARLAALPDVAGVAHVWIGFPTRVAGRTVTTFAERREVGDAGFIIVSGRAPADEREVALGAKTMRHVHAGIGDRVRVGSRWMTIVGQAIFPVTDDGYPLADGALLSDKGFDAVGLTQTSGFGTSGYNTYAVKLRAGADRSAAVRELRALDYGGDPPMPTRTPPEVDQLEQLDRLPTILAVFLLVVALLALGHALVLTVRHRRAELAVARTIGLTPGQTARSVAWQATTLGAVGALLGLPIGLVVGRIVWAAVARSYGIADDTAWPWLAVALTLPVVVVLANLLAWWPGHRAARLRPAEILRSE